MRVLLVQIDGRKDRPNLALEKIAVHHQNNGDDVWCDPAFADQADKIYVSCIFDWNREKAMDWAVRFPGKVEIGGSGVDLRKRLPEEIESIKPRINWGFTTRGCIRMCSFCVVPEKEGFVHVVGDLLGLWNGDQSSAGRERITVLDNNILSLPKHFDLICDQAREHKLKVDFNQGLDFRLLNEEIIGQLKSIRHHEYRFAFDHPSYMKQIGKAIAMLKAGGVKRGRWYVLVGFDEDVSLQQDVDRLNFLRSHGQDAYIQRHVDRKTRAHTALARWVNQPWIFRKNTLGQFLELHKDTRVYKPLFKGIDLDGGAA